MYFKPVDFEEEGDVGVWQAIVALPWLPGEEYSMQLGAGGPFYVDWWRDGIYTGKIGLSY